jgi:hypothetical protein
MATEGSASEKPQTLPPPAWEAVKLFAAAYRVELILFVISYAALASFSSQRFLRQSEAPHFVYQAKAWLDGRMDLDPRVLPNLEDWACVREIDGARHRCEGQVRETDKWYVSFPSFPAAVMLPFVAVNGYQLNDTSFGVFIGALAVAFFYAWLRQLSQKHGSGRIERENAALAAVLAFGSVFFYCAIRGEVWFSAEVMGVLFTALYARNATQAHRPVLAGVFFSMAVLTRTPLLFAGVYFVMEVLCPTKGKRLEELKAFTKEKQEKLLQFASGAAPLGLLHAWYNLVRFGSPFEFGHRFLYNNRVNADIDTFGLFHPHYLLRNLDAAFAMLPQLHNGQLLYSPWGLSLLLTLPLLVFVFISPKNPKHLYPVIGAAVAVLFFSAILPEEPPPPGEFPIGHRSALVWVAIVGLFGAWWVGASQDEDAPRLKAPLIAAALACAIPGLLYQNTGYAQFGFRFSLDYTPYLIAAFAVSAWSFRHRAVQVALVLTFVVAFWGAVAFRGYTEGVRGW